VRGAPPAQGGPVTLDAVAKGKEAKAVKKPALGTEGRRVRLPGFRMFQETISELRKVVWPNRQDALRLTVMVIIVSVAVGLAMGIVDYIFAQMVDRLLLGGG